MDYVCILRGKFAAGTVLCCLFQYVSNCDFCNLYFEVNLAYKFTWYVHICHMVTTLGNCTVLVCLVLGSMPSNSEISKDLPNQYIHPLQQQILLFFDLGVPSPSMVLILAFMWAHCTTHITLRSFQQHVVFSLATTPCFMAFDASMVLVQKCHYGNAEFQPKFQIVESEETILFFLVFIAFIPLSDVFGCAALAVSPTTEALVHVTAFATVRKSETNVHSQQSDLHGHSVMGSLEAPPTHLTNTIVRDQVIVASDSGFALKSSIAAQDSLHYSGVEGNLQDSLQVIYRIAPSCYSHGGFISQDIKAISFTVSALPMHNQSPQKPIIIRVAHCENMYFNRL